MISILMTILNNLDNAIDAKKDGVFIFFTWKNIHFAKK
ncbi:MAG: hypothetical protein Rpha_2063 [Candidatus Ruthia sp. Apha_13_S6]|nr:hypothetical protein [Candidatus Ruthia sp. Apha_13_S6]